MAFALNGIKVIEAAVAAAGPLAGRLLADWGADVIHVEPTGKADMSRQRAILHSGRIIGSDIDFYSQNLNRNKRAMTLDLSQDTGQEILHKMLAKADIFISNFRPRELKKFHLEYGLLNQLNPRLIYANVTGYGKKGPHRDMPAFDHISYYSRSGFSHVLQMPESPPPQTPIASGDNVVALALALGIMAALFAREKTGVGQEVNVSLYQVGVFTISRDIDAALTTRQDRRPLERKDIANALLNSYQTKDKRWLRLGLGQPDTYWHKFCQAIGRGDLENDPRFATFEPRIDNHAVLFHTLEEVFLTRTLEEWKVPLYESGIPWSPVQSLVDVIDDPQARANGFFVSFDHPAYGRMELVNNPVHLSNMPSSIRLPAPEYNQNTEEILLEYGCTWEDISQFKEKQVIA